MLKANQSTADTENTTINIFDAKKKESNLDYDYKLI